MWIYDSETFEFLDVNEAAVLHYGYKREEFLSMRIMDIRPAEDTSRLMQLIEQRRTGQVDYFQSAGEWRHLLKDGRVINVEIVSHPIDLSRGKAVLVAAHDITDRKNAELALRKSEERYRLLFERNLAGVYRTTLDGTILDCNEACARILGYQSREDLMCRSSLESYFDPAEREEAIGRLRDAGKLSNFEIRLRRKNAAPVWVLQNMTLVTDGEGGEIIEGTMVDITDQKAAEERAAFLAYHDALTDLPNRSLLTLRLKLALSHSRERRLPVAVLYLDLDHFKDVNDTLGHRFGDQLLRAVATRLRASISEEHMLARVGGDEFVIALHILTSPSAVAAAATKALESLRDSFEVEGHTFYVGASIGVAISPEDGEDAETLLRNAGSALHRAKTLGRGRYHLCTANMTQPARDRLDIETGLRRALAHEELMLYYQPLFEVETRSLVGVEALVRWRRSGHVVEPIDFLAVAEESDLILPIGEWVLRRACTQSRIWQDKGFGPLRVAVNVSARQMQSDLAMMVTRVLAETGLHPSLLDIEITESAAMQNAETTLRLLQSLRAMGIQISVDDFGTGYSSLNYLKNFPIDLVKIDRIFVRDLASSETDRSIVTAIITLAHAMKLRVIAEGVESEEQVDFLRQQGCEQMQGFLLARPLPPEEFELLRRKEFGFATRAH